MKRLYMVSLDTLIDDVLAEVVIGNYDDEDMHEYAIQWRYLGAPGEHHIVPVLRVFDDAWKFLYEHNLDVLAMMASVNNQDISVEDFCNKLEEIGVTMLARIE